MNTNLEKFKGDLKVLINTGEKLNEALQYQFHKEEFEIAYKKVLKQKYKKYLESLPSFSSEYQSWYSECLVLLKQLLPDRVDDFRKLYERPRQKRKDITHENYTIEDCLHGLEVSRTDGYEKKIIADGRAAIPRVQQQLNIVKAAERRFESSLFDIKQLVQADLFDSELEAAHELRKKGFFRAAGAVAGVVLEKHLSVVCENHQLTPRKKNSTISDFNDRLKDSGIIDVAAWRKVQHLADIRNLCDHKKHREPNDEDIMDLVDGVSRIVKTIF